MSKSLIFVAETCDMSPAWMRFNKKPMAAIYAWHWGDEAGGLGDGSPQRGPGTEPWSGGQSPQKL